MFVAFMISVKVTINGEELNCYEIFRTILKQTDIRLQGGGFDEPVRQEDEMPEAIKKLIVSKSHPLAALGLFMPIKRWVDFQIYEKGSFNE